jgi:hypothetical protein
MLAVVPSLVVLAACSSTGGGGMSLSSSAPEYWRSASGSIEGFRHDNAVCTARAARFGNVDPNMTPDNRMDRPMQKWPNAVAQEAYENCMYDVGWHSMG